MFYPKYLSWVSTILFFVILWLDDVIYIKITQYKFRAKIKKKNKDDTINLILLYDKADWRRRVFLLTPINFLI